MEEAFVSGLIMANVRGKQKGGTKSVAFFTIVVFAAGLLRFFELFCWSFKLKAGAVSNRMQ